MVERTCRMVASRSETASFEPVRHSRRLGCSGHALEGQRHSEETLDHGVVEIPGHSVPVLVDRHLLHASVEASVLDGDPRRQGEGLDQRLVVAGELGPADLVGEIEVPVDLAPHL